MTNDLIEFLMEDCQFADIMSIDILEEGLFDRKGYRVSLHEYKDTISARSTVFNTAIKALRSEIGIQCYGKLKEWKQYESNINEYNTEIIINKKYENKLDTIVYLYTCEIKNSFIGNDKKYGTQLQNDAKIINTEKNTLRNFIKKYNIPISIVDTDGGSDDRSKVLSTVIGIFKKELKTFKTKYPIKDSIYIPYNDEFYKKDKEDFIDGVHNSINIAEYDLWKFNKNARDDSVNNEFWKYADELTNTINKEISKYGAKVVSDGDWDTGSFYLEIK